MRTLAALLLTVAAPAIAKETAVQHATGTFEVKVTPEATTPGSEGALPTARMGIAKTFGGDLTATAAGTMLSIGTPQPGQAASYVAVDQVTGTLAGRSGGFVLLHRGSMSDAGQELSVEIAPGSGTGQLAGIAGTLAIVIEGGVHRYDLSYTLPR